MELQSLSRIANALNRSLVLPPLPRRTRTLKYGNLCAFDIANCQMEVISNFSLPVKESVFFTSDLIPSFIVEENRNNPIFSFESDCVNNGLYSSDYPANQLNHNSISCIPCEDSKEECIIRKGLETNSYVYKVFSI